MYMYSIIGMLELQAPTTKGILELQAPTAKGMLELQAPTTKGMLGLQAPTAKGMLELQDHTIQLKRTITICTLIPSTVVLQQCTHTHTHSVLLTKVIGAGWMVVVDVGDGEGSLRAGRLVPHKQINVRVYVTFLQHLAHLLTQLGRGGLVKTPYYSPWFLAKN